MMSTLLVFSPEGIILTGDNHPGSKSGRGGVIARGYGLEWFSQKLEPDYLAGKFLIEVWVPERFSQAVRDYICDGFHARTLSTKRRPWRVGKYVQDEWTEIHALRYLISNPELIETSHNAYDNLPAFRQPKSGWVCIYDSDFVLAGYGYDPTELGWLAAIQRRFSELIAG
jgi:hypothetical protein